MITESIIKNRFLKWIYSHTKYEKDLSISNTINRLHNSVYKTRIHTSSVNGSWNVLFFGSDSFSLESLKSLHKEYRSKTLSRLEVVTTHKGKENVVTRYAKENDLIIHHWPLSDTLTNFHIGIVVSFGQLIPSKVINSFPLGMINTHASLLPRWRGAAPLIYSLMNGDSQTGISLMVIKPKKFDRGEILLQVPTDIDPHETLQDLHSKLAKMAADVLTENLQQLPELIAHAKPQSTTGITYAPKVTSKLSKIHWDKMTAKDVYNLQRALTGFYPLTAQLETVTIKLLGIKEFNGPFKACQYEDPPGFLEYNDKDNILTVKCKGYTWISVKTIIVPRRAPINAKEFNNGYLSGRRKRGIVLT